MRVAQVLPAFFADRLDPVGGGDRYVFNLARALRPYCDVTLFTFGLRYHEESLDGLHHVVLPAGRHSNPDNPVPRSLSFTSGRFDVVHSHQLRTAVTSIATLIRRATHKPLLVTDLGGGGRSAMFRLKLYRLIPAFACISEFSRTLLPAGVRARAVVVKGGLDLERFPFHAGPRPRQVLQVGRIMPHKGMNYVIEAIGKDIPLVIAGHVIDPAYYRDVRRMAEGKQVRFLVKPADDTVLRLYQQSSVTVAASVYRDMYGGYWPTSELLGLPLLESMAVGTPVICTDVGGMPEYVRDGETGFIVPPNDSAALRGRLVDVLDDPVRASRLGTTGHQDVQRYSWDAVARQMSTLYAKLGRRPV